MSILNRPGWNNRIILTEGRLHSDELKQRIGNLFKRTSLGNSPTYVVAKISELLRREKGEDVDINDITDEDIIVIANSEEVTNGKFSPELKDAIESSRQESGDQISDISDSELPSEKSDESDSETEEPEVSDMSDEEPSIEGGESFEDEEDAEAVKASSGCECHKKQNVNTIGTSGPEITKESVKLSPTQVNKLLKENYIKSQQQKFRVEERYRF